MEMFQSTKRSTAQGFSLLEVTFAIAILGIGMLGAAALMAQMFGNTTNSRYMSTESLLASEKLDDLNRYLTSDPAIAVPAGTTAGNLDADATATVTINGTATPVDYWDEIQISSANGASANAGVMEETVSKVVGGALVFTTTTHKADGTIASVDSAAPPATTSDTLKFKRRWLIEKDVPINGLPLTGASRITVRVILQDPANPATFQTSFVRQAQ